MANKTLFKTYTGKLLPQTDGYNEHGSPAYRFTPKHALAQYASTGCFNGTFYSTDKEHLDRFLALAAEVDLEFLAKTAVYCRREAHMKDAPALLTAFLASKSPELLERVFPAVIDNGKMLRNFVQFIRSGVTGRKSLGTRPKKLILQWLESKEDAQLFKAAVGNTPSLADVVKMVHPKPTSKGREALYGYILGRAYHEDALPQVVRDFESFKAGERDTPPKVPFEMLTALNLNTDHWVEIARNASWQMMRMNLNSFLRHGVFDAPGMTEFIATRLKNEKDIKKARVFPYQLLAAYMNANSGLPQEITIALQDAMEISTANVPKINGRVVVCPDVSGSMSWASVTGYRQGSTSKVRCIDVAALFASSILRNNPTASVIPFETGVVDLKLNSRDSVMTNAQKLASIGGGGTNCSAPLRLLNQKREKVDLVVMISDNESWVDINRGRGTALMKEWTTLKSSNPNARLVCIDIQPYGSSQALDRDDVLNVGGFSDQVFRVVNDFNAGHFNGNHWVRKIEEIKL